MDERVLIIENQYLQFMLLGEGLSTLKERPMTVIPSYNDKEEYRRLISAVKVFVNKEYPKQYRDKSQDVIFDFVAGKDRLNPVDLIILDYKLGGSIECLTGVDVAKLIWSYFPRIPVLFLSRVDYSVKDRFLQFEDIEMKYKKEWLMKGFMGDKALDDDFIHYTIYNKIAALLDGPSTIRISENDELINKVKYIINLQYNPYTELWNILLTYLKDVTKPSLPFQIKKILIEHDKNSASIDGDLMKFIKSITS